MTEDREPVNDGTAQQGQGKEEMSETEIDDTLKGSFPASDPPSWTLGTDHSEESQNEEGGSDESGEAE